MLTFKVVETIHRIGPKKGQKAYSAVQKSQSKFSQEWLVEEIVRETSLSEGDVRNVLITLRNVVRDVIKLGGSVDLGDIFSLRTVIPSKMEADETDVCADSLKRPRILVRWKSSITEVLKKIQVEVDNPKRREKFSKKKKKDDESGKPGQGGSQVTP